MSDYINAKVNISEGQKEKIKLALKNKRQVSIRLKYEDLHGKDVIALTKSQVNKLTKAYKAGKGTTIRMSIKQLKHNMKVKGGFLPLIAGLASAALPVLAKTVLPALGVGALTGLASTGVQKAMGNGLFLKKLIVKVYI